MRPEGVASAQRELKRALRARDHFVMATDPEAMEDAWDTFLTHAGRVYEKLRAACHGQLDWPWWRKQMDRRRDDELLLYIHKARNSETHRLESATQYLLPGNYQFDLKDYGRIVEYVGFPQLMPLPVRDREGNIYDPPCRHNGRFIGRMDAGTIIWLASTHLQDLVREAASRLR